MGLSRVFGLCAALLFASSPVSAAVTIDLGPSDYKKFGPNAQHTATGVRSSFGQTVRIPPVSSNLTVSRNPVIPYGSIANGLRNLARTSPGAIAASAVMSTIFIGLDWVFDQGEWKKLEEGWITDPDFVGWTGVVGSCNVSAPTPELACSELVSSCQGREYTRYTLSSSGRSATCFGIVNGQEFGLAGASFVGQCPQGSVFNPSTGNCDLTEGRLIPLTDADYSRIEGYLPTANPELSAESAAELQQRQGAPLPGYHDTTITGPASTTGPETTTTTTTEAGDSVVTTTTTTTNYSYGDTTITTTNTTTTNTYTNGTHTSTETTTETPGELPVTEGGGAPPAGEWPGFCEWASIVCEWIGWTQEEPDPEPDLPQVVDDDFYEEKTIQFGAKTCPPDYEINIPFINSVVAVPMQPLCDLAGIIYYMVMAAAYIIAAYITIGVARNG